MATRPQFHKCLGALAPGRAGLPGRSLALTVRAAKGFGKAKPQPARHSDDDEEGAGQQQRRRKGKTVKLYPGAMGLIPGQAQQQRVAGPPQAEGAAGAAPGLLVPSAPTEEEDDFNARLSALKESGRERAAASALTAATGGVDALSAAPAIFDTKPAAGGAGAAGAAASDDIYANPPPLAQTLLKAAGGGAAASSISDPALRDANIGPSQLGLAGGALVFIAVFLVVAAGDYAPASKRYAGVRPAQSPPDAIEAKILAGKVALYEDQIKADPTNDAATEALATTYAQLLQYDKAAALLEKLTKRNPADSEAWRLLGESSLLSQQSRKAVPAFEKAVELRRAAVGPAVNTPGGVVMQPDLQLLTGLTDAYIANGDYGKAVDALKGVREELRAAAQQPPRELPSTSTSTSSAAAVSTTTSQPPVLQAPALTDDGPSTTTSEPAAASASTTSTPTSTSTASTTSTTSSGPDLPPARPLDPVGLELLTAKSFAAWRGHEQDALATYEELIKAFPEDYRGYLAKGVFLKERGRKADAERMFLQARFYAPASKQQLVRAIADATPTAPMLPDNN
ncbi:hypothetical protein HYH02_010881 [Chlamydomonas schloesseri]|uniref:Uncharacterized protein n=1 Tax=Chlamydomonas schloesseri TaxID=2026947 RepID=A0A835THJ4_9CHLO|nr:hypothetical protein HYH02_010881 [Chlamydomonas schloesseri]|eukprot:KAG2438426.1 hypothetical protein HYH02_010881 [Chlamydomonas schloesseri]